MTYNPIPEWVFNDTQRSDRLAELTAAFGREEEVMMDNGDLIVLGRDPSLGPGEKVSSETGEVQYSADWL